MSIHPLRAARETRNLSMRQLAEKAGLGKYGHRRIYGWEHGEMIPTLPYATLLAPHLGFESGEVLREVCIKWIERANEPVGPAPLDSDRF